MIQSDQREQLKTLTLRKALNLARLFLSFHLSNLLKRPVVWGMPFSISVEPTTACNLGCPECPSGLKSFSRPTGKLKAETLEGILDELSPTLGNLIFYFQGEPYLHPQFTDLVAMAHRRRIYTVTSTNAHFLTPENARKTVESGLSRLIISIDGTTQESYANYRIHGQLEKVIEGSKNIVAARKALNSPTPHLIFQFLVVRQNEHQIDAVHQLAEEIGIDEVRLKTAQVYDYENGHPLIPQNPKYSRYVKQSNGKWALKNKLLNRCWRMWQGCVFTWDGKVVPCCFDKDAQHQLGSIANGSFRSIWRSEPYMHFRKSILTSRSSIDICTNCTEGTQVIVSPSVD